MTYLDDGRRFPEPRQHVSLCLLEKAGPIGRAVEHQVRLGRIRDMRVIEIGVEDMAAADASDKVQREAR